MDKLILWHNHFYNQSASILKENVKKLFEKLQIPIAEIWEIACENRLLPLVNEVEYYGKILQALNNAKKQKMKLLVCDSQSLLAIKRVFEKYFMHSNFKEEVNKKIGEVDILELEDAFVFAPEIVLQAFVRDNQKRTWEGFKCAFLLDRELESMVKETYIVEKFENLLGAKIYPFYKDSYDYLLHINKDMAYKMGGKDYYEMVDCGVDFIMTPNIGNFELLDGHSKKIKKSAGRDDLEVPILYIPQVFLALFKECNAQDLMFFKHNISPKML